MREFEGMPVFWLPLDHLDGRKCFIAPKPSQDAQHSLARRLFFVIFENFGTRNWTNVLDAHGKNLGGTWDGTICPRRGNKIGHSRLGPPHVGKFEFSLVMPDFHKPRRSTPRRIRFSPPYDCASKCARMIRAAWTETEHWFAAASALSNLAACKGNLARTLFVASLADMCAFVFDFEVLDIVCRLSRLG